MKKPYRHPTGKWIIVPRKRKAVLAPLVDRVRCLHCTRMFSVKKPEQIWCSKTCTEYGMRLEAERQNKIDHERLRVRRENCTKTKRDKTS